MKKRKTLIPVLSAVIILLAVWGGFKLIEASRDNREAKRGNGQESFSNTVQLLWYQIGDPQTDMDKVLEKVNEYTSAKIGVSLRVIQIGWGDYNRKMQLIINTGDEYDMAFTSSWANNYLLNAQKGVFLALNDYLPKYGKEMYEKIDPKFWEAAKVGGVIYGVPGEKEIGNMPMWVFTKKYVDKYNIPYKEIHSLEDLEPWLELIKEKEPGIVPLYLTSDYSAPIYMDLIQEPVGIEYGDTSLTVKNVFETAKMRETLKVMRKYYQKGYINQNAAVETDDKSVKRFVTKGDGQPYAELIWSKDLGYDVVASTIMDVQITNASARGALTAISENSKHPEEAVKFLNLVNTDEYLRNLLNYGIEGVHYEKVPLTKEDKEKAKGKPYVFDTKIRLIPENQKKYSVPYWVQGGLFNTYVTESEPIDKWSEFKSFNDSLETAPSFGFDFYAEPVITQISGFRSILDEFGSALYTGSVDTDEYLNKLNAKLKTAGIQDVINEMQAQVNLWRHNK